MFTDGALARRAITGVFIEFAGATVDCCMQRQHLTAPDVHTVELVAATTRAGCIALLYFVAHYRNYTFLKSLRRRIGCGFAIDGCSRKQQTWPEAFTVERAPASSTHGRSGT